MPEKKKVIADADIVGKAGIGSEKQKVITDADIFAETPHSEPKPATTTHQEDLTTHGQRRINLIWEITQAFVAVAVTVATLYVSGRLALKDEKEAAAFLLLSNAFFLVIGFYFGRTNHQKVGGVGGKDIGR